MSEKYLTIIAHYSFEICTFQTIFLVMLFKIEPGNTYEILRQEQNGENKSWGQLGNWKRLGWLLVVQYIFGPKGKVLFLFLVPVLKFQKVKWNSLEMLSFNCKVKESTLSWLIVISNLKKEPICVQSLHISSLKYQSKQLWEYWLDSIIKWNYCLIRSHTFKQ